MNSFRKPILLCLLVGLFLVPSSCGRSNAPTSNQPHDSGNSGVDMPNPNEETTENEDPNSESPSNEETNSNDDPDSQNENDTETTTPNEETETEPDPETETDPESDPETDPETDPDPGEFVPPPTPTPGNYTYTRLPIGGLDEVRRIEFHPSGDYALILESTDEVHIYQWESQSAIRIPFDSHFESVRWNDLAFDPSGDFALLIGILNSSSETEGRMYRFDHFAFSENPSRPPEEYFSEIESARIPQELKAIQYSWEATNPVVLAISGANSAKIASLREFSITDNVFSGLYTSTSSGWTGCDDLGFVNNEFGTWGILVTCGSGGADNHYYTEIGGIGEWRHDPGNGNTGNTSRIGVHRGGDYALMISWSGRRVYRFESGVINSSSDAPGFSTKGIWGIKFQQEGQRALIVGRTSVSVGSILEFRHDSYACPYPTPEGCGIHDVSIPEFTSAPYNATSNTYLLDAAFKPNCDGGLIGGGTNGASGLLIQFQIADARECN